MESSGRLSWNVVFISGWLWSLVLWGFLHKSIFNSSLFRFSFLVGPVTTQSSDETNFSKWHSGHESIAHNKDPPPTHWYALLLRVTAPSIARNGDGVWPKLSGVYQQATTVLPRTVQLASNCRHSLSSVEILSEFKARWQILSWISSSLHVMVYDSTYISNCLPMDFLWYRRWKY